MSQVTHLARQLFSGEKAKRMIDAYIHATKDPFSYLVLDLKSDTPDMIRMKANVLPKQGCMFQQVHLSHCYPL